MALTTASKYKISRSKGIKQHLTHSATKVVKYLRFTSLDAEKRRNFHFFEKMNEKSSLSVTLKIGMFFFCGRNKNVFGNNTSKEQT